MSDELQKIGWGTTRTEGETYAKPREPVLNDATGEVAGSENGPEIIVPNDAGSTNYHFPSIERLNDTSTNNSGATLIGVESGIFNLISGTDVQAVLENIDSTMDGINTTAILKDGTVAWTANQSVGGYKFTNLLGIAHTGSISIDIDSDNNGTTETFKVTKDNGATTLITIKEAGEMGIGTTSPSELLHILSSANDAKGIIVENNQNATTAGASITLKGDSGQAVLNYFSTGHTGSTILGQTRADKLFLTGNSQCGGMVIGTEAAVDLVFGTNNTNRLKIDSNGDFIYDTNANRTHTASVAITATATTTNIDTFSLSTANTSYTIIAHVNAQKNDGSATKSWKQVSTFQNDGGTVTQVGSTADLYTPQENAGASTYGVSWSLGASSVTVAGIPGADTVEFRMYFEVFEHTL